MADTLEVDVHDVQSLLSSSERDYLVRNNGDQIVDSVIRKLFVTIDCVMVQLRAELCFI
ncbi:hypothetical protein HanOQP8_Chr17g0647961 [Helianthus annuus]|nr:hypothetical protein HanLR1_Chr17g0652321 [Helianthus annuus]KAJ0635174.1 hypothetical protein HanOQP8_Chr17g0647961 [Helianthus annuus]